MAHKRRVSTQSSSALGVAVIVEVLLFHVLIGAIDDEPKPQREHLNNDTEDEVKRCDASRH